MVFAVSNPTMRQADRRCIDAGTPATTLMYRAGCGIRDAFPFDRHTPVAIFCGSGNNGGDGFVLALLLTERSISCTIVLAEEKWSPDGWYYFEQCKNKGIPVVLWSADFSLSGYGAVVDCLFGTGFHGILPPLYEDMIRQMNGAGLPIVAADIPSGLSGDNGKPAHTQGGEPLAVRATVTVSIGSPKLGHFLASGKEYCGRLQNIDIGIPIEPTEDVPDERVLVPEEGDFGSILPHRASDSHKGTYGYVAVLGGCRNYSGAIKLANLAASSLRCGCGVVKLLCADSILPSVAPYLLESTAVPLPDHGGDLDFDPAALEQALTGTRALAVGMGWGNGAHNEEILTWLLQNYPGTLILDADGLNCLGRMAEDTRHELFEKRYQAERTTILTPHPMEFSRISGVPIAECDTNPIPYCKHYAAENHVILLRKGPGTIVTDGYECYIVTRGCAGMATAGSGDVLSGVLAGLAGYNCGSAMMVACGAYLAGLAGEMAQTEMGEIGMVASDTVRYLATATKQLQEKGKSAPTEQNI